MAISMQASSLAEREGTRVKGDGLLHGALLFLACMQQLMCTTL